MEVVTPVHPFNDQLSPKWSHTEPSDIVNSPVYAEIYSKLCNSMLLEAGVDTSVYELDQNLPQNQNLPVLMTCTTKKIMQQYTYCTTWVVDV